MLRGKLPLFALAALTVTLGGCGTTRTAIAPELPLAAPQRPSPTVWLPVDIQCGDTECVMTREGHTNLLMNLADINRWVGEATNLLDFYDDRDDGRDEEEGSLDPR